MPSDEITAGTTVKAAVCVAPPDEPEIVADVDAATALVVTLKVALVAPAAIVRLEGTEAAPLSLVSATCAPPAGAGASSITVPVTGVPPLTLAWLRLTADTLGGTTVSDALCVAPP